jgi:hypothetical protein
MVSYAFRDVNVTSGDIRAHISGDTVVLASGQEVIVSISGQQIDFVSGIAIALSGLNVITTIPNINVNVGSVSVNSGLGVIVQSGVNVINSQPSPPTVIRARSPIMVSDSSGGVILSSGQTREVTIRALDGDIYVGSPIGNDMPYSGCGVLIQQGDTASIPIDNFNNVAVFAAVSGNRVSFGGVY